MCWLLPHPHPRPPAAPAPTAPVQLSASRCPCLTFMFSSAPRVFILHIRLSATETWGEFGIDWTPAPVSIHNHPTKATLHPPLVERIPICPGAKFQPCFERVASPEKAPASPAGPKNATNYWEKALLLTPDRYCWGSELTLPDTLGDGGGTYCLEPPLLHHVSLLCNIGQLPL